MCERRYALDAVTPRTPSTIAQRRGDQVHAIYEWLANQRIRGRVWHDDTLWEEAVTATKGPLTEELCRLYIEKIKPVLSPLKVEAAEQWIDKIRWGGQELRFRFAGKIDLVARNEDGELVVIDYKTTSSDRNIPQQWQAKRSLQLRIYCLATGAKRARYVYLLKSRPAIEIEVEFTDEELGQAFRWLRATESAIERRWETGGWSLSDPGSALCSKKWCSHWGACLGGKESIAEYLERVVPKPEREDE